MSRWTRDCSSPVDCTMNSTPGVASPNATYSGNFSDLFPSRPRAADQNATARSCSAAGTSTRTAVRRLRCVMTRTLARVSRTYDVRTYGCQMNVHDSERIAGLLEEAGYVKAGDATADVVVFNTCAVRENADNRLYGNLGQLLPVKKQHPGMQIADGGCLAQKDQGTIVERAAWVDVVFGTHNVGSLPALLERARIAQES